MLMHHHFSSNGNNNCVQSEDAGLQAANKCISTSAATEVRCSDVEMRGVGTAPTLTAAAAPAPVLSPRMVGPWLRGAVPSPPAPSSVVST